MTDRLATARTFSSAEPQPTPLGGAASCGPKRLCWRARHPSDLAPALQHSRACFRSPLITWFAPAIALAYEGSPSCTRRYDNRVDSSFFLRFTQRTHAHCTSEKQKRPPSTAHSHGKDKSEKNSGQHTQHTSATPSTATRTLMNTAAAVHFHGHAPLSGYKNITR